MSSSKFYSTNTKYTRLFLSILSIFIVSPFGYYFEFIKFILALFFFIIILLAIDTLSVSPRLIFASRLVAIISLICGLTDVNSSPFLTKFLDIIYNFSFSIFISLAIIAISARIAQEKMVNLDVIRGSICVYLMLGIFWFYLYNIVYSFDVNGFIIGDFHNKVREGNLLYFSFTTLTTLGYGDISPINPFAMALANIEALVGQLYVAITIAKLVGTYQNDQS